MRRVRLGVLAVLFACAAAMVQAADAPKVIRIGAPAISGNVQGIWGATGIARKKGWFEQEFAKDGIRVEFPGFIGGGPMVGQALANGQIDFAGNGDMISLIGKSAGIHSKLIAAGSRLENAYLLVRPDSPIKTLSDLRGKKVGYFKGNYIQLQAIRILNTAGLTERDVRAVNLNWVTGQSALLSGDIDALFGGAEAFNLKEKGAARIIFSTQGKPRLTAQAGLLVSEDFATKYPDLTKRVLKVIVKAAYWASQESNRDAAYAIWTQGGYKDLATLREDYGDRPLADRVSPLLDPFFFAQYKDTQTLIGGLGLLRGGPVNIDRWFDSSYLTAALRELGLQDYWVPLDAEGVRQRTAAAPSPAAH